MVYNIKKRDNEELANILNIVYSSFFIIAACIVIIAGTVYLEYQKDPIFIILGIILLIIGIINIVFSSKLVKSPLLSDMTVKNKKSTRICALVFMIITFSWMSAGILISVMSSPDFIEKSN